MDRAGEDARRPRRHGVEDAAPPRAQKRPKPQPHSVPSPSESSQSRPNRPSPPRDRGPTCPLGYPHPRSPASGGVPAPARQRLPRPPTRGPHCLLRRPQGRRPLPPHAFRPRRPPHADGPATVPVARPFCVESATAPPRRLCDGGGGQARPAAGRSVGRCRRASAPSARSRVGGERFHVYSCHLAPLYALNPRGSDCPHLPRLPALLETSPRGAAACCAPPQGRPRAAWCGTVAAG